VAGRGALSKKPFVLKDKQQKEKINLFIRT
jgi:hypothetical protein